MIEGKACPYRILCVEWWDWHRVDAGKVEVNLGKQENVGMSL